MAINRAVIPANRMKVLKVLFMTPILLINPAARRLLNLRCDYLDVNNRQTAQEFWQAKPGNSKFSREQSRKDRPLLRAQGTSPRSRIADGPPRDSIGSNRRRKES